MMLHETIEMAANHRTIFQASPDTAYQIQTDRTLYLDTSVVRSLGGRLRDWPYRDQSYTSALTLIELLNGISRNADEFSRRRSAIIALERTGIALDWQFPEIKLRCAFRRLREKYDIYEKRIECLEKVLWCLRKAQSLQDFVESEAKLTLPFRLEHLSAYDDDMSRGVRDAARKWIPIYRQTEQHPSTATFYAMFGLPPDTPRNVASAHIHSTSFYLGSVVYSMTQKFAAEEDITGDDEATDLFKSYDGSAHVYIRAVSSEQGRHAGLSNMPDRNRGQDLHHLLYLVPLLSKTA